MRHTEEDWERLPELDKMYLLEKQREMEEEWWEQECREKDKELKEALIKVKIEKEKKKKKNEKKR